MGLQVLSERCNSCGKCVDICPGDLLLLDAGSKSSIRNQADCWDCMACVKACPRGALKTRLPFSLADFGASLEPEISATEIQWTCTYEDGRTEQFIMPRV